MVTVVPGQGDGKSNIGVNTILSDPNTYAWRDIASCYANVGGTWKQVSAGYANVNGSWRLLDLGAPSYTFKFGNKVSCSTNGYLSFDNDNTNLSIAKTLGRVLGVLPADLYLNSVQYLSSSFYFIVRFSGRRLSSATANEIQFEVWFPDQSDFCYVWLQTFPSGTYDATGFYKAGTVYGRVTSSRIAGTVYKVNFGSVNASVYSSGSTWGLGAGFAGLIDVTGQFSAYDDGYYSMNTAASGNPTAVLNLKASSVGKTGTVISWSLPSDPGQSAIQNYDWALSSDDGVTWGAATNVTTTSITLGTLTTDTKYRVRVRPYNFYNNVGPWTDTGTFSFTAPGAFTYQAYDGTTVPTKPTVTEYRGYDSSAWGNQSIIDIAASFPSDTTGYTYAAWGGAFSTTATTETTPAYSGSIGTLNLFPDSAWTPTSTTTGGDYSFTINATTAAFGYIRVTANNVNNKKALLSWSTSTNAQSYKVNYTVTNAGAANGTYNSNVTGPTPNTYLYVTLGTAGTVTINSVTAYDTTDCTGTNTTLATLYYNPVSGTFGASSITPTDKSTKSDILTVGTYKIRYYPSVTLSAPTSVTSTGGTINWSGSNISSWSISGDLSASSTTSGTSKAFTGLTASTTYNYTVTVTSSDNHTASATADANNNSTYRLTTTAAASVPPTPSAPTLTYVSANNTTSSWGYKATFTTVTANPAVDGYYFRALGVDGITTTARGPFTSSPAYFTLAKTQSTWAVALVAHNSQGNSTASGYSNYA